MIVSRCNINLRQYNLRLYGKSWKKASNITIYRYKNDRQEQKTLKRYLLFGRVG